MKVDFAIFMLFFRHADNWLIIKKETSSDLALQALQISSYRQTLAQVHRLDVVVSLKFQSLGFREPLDTGKYNSGSQPMKSTWSPMYTLLSVPKSATIAYFIPLLSTNTGFSEGHRQDRLGIPEQFSCPQDILTAHKTRASTGKAQVKEIFISVEYCLLYQLIYVRNHLHGQSGGSGRKEK